MADVLVMAALVLFIALAVWKVSRGGG